MEDEEDDLYGTAAPDAAEDDDDPNKNEAYKLIQWVYQLCRSCVPC